MADKTDLTMGMANAVDTYIVQPNSKETVMTFMTFRKLAY